MARKDPAASAKKWQENAKSGVRLISEGVDRVDESPGVAAARKVEKMRTNFNAAIDSGKTQERLQSVDLNDWKTSMKTKAVQRIPGGVDAAVSKVAEFHTQLADHQATIDNELKRMPDTTLEDGIARATHQMRKMSEFRFKR